MDQVGDRASMQDQLEQAVAVARTRGRQEGRQGVLAPRHDYGCFTVALSESVPFGLTLELWGW